MSKRIARIPARKVRTPDGATTHLPAVSLADATTLIPLWCAACSKNVPARGQILIASRDSDTRGVFDVWYCTRACRDAFVGAA